jgi:hypothetical protein
MPEKPSLEERRKAAVLRLSKEGGWERFCEEANKLIDKGVKKPPEYVPGLLEEIMDTRYT